MKITITNYTQDEKFEVVYNALCNGLDGLINHYSFDWEIVNQAMWTTEKQKLTTGSEHPCLENIMIAYMKAGGELEFTCAEFEEDDAMYCNKLSLTTINANWDKIRPQELLAYYKEEDDAETAESVLQCLLLGSIVLG